MGPECSLLPHLDLVVNYTLIVPTRSKRVEAKEYESRQLATFGASLTTLLLQQKFAYAEIISCLIRTLKTSIAWSCCSPTSKGPDRFFIEVPDGSRYHFHCMCIMDWLIAA
jgi:hypothetical protein